MNTRLLTPQDYLRAVISRKWLVVGSIVVSLAIAWGVCLRLPRIYRSTTSMLVEAQKIPESYVKGVDTVQDIMNALRQVIVSRKLLAQIAQEFHLDGYDKDQSSPEVQDGIVRGIRGKVNVEISKDQGFLTVSFPHENPVVARDVTARLAALFIEENLRNRAETVEGATEFLEQELNAAKSDLEVKERAIAQFKQAHLGELPQQVEANLRTLDRLQNETKDQNEMEYNLNNRLVSLNKLLKEFEDENSQTPGAAPKRATDPRLARIRELERSLMALSAMYKETYPDVVQVREELKKLKEMSTKQYMGILPEPEEAQESSTGKSHKAKIVDPYYVELLKQRDEINSEIAAVKRRQTRIAAEMKEYEARVEKAPEREQRLTTLTRDYENMQRNYQSLLDRKLNAGITGNLEKKRKGSQIRIIDPANLPVLPETPKIQLIMLIGLGIGCALGFGGAVGLELLCMGFRSPEEVEVVLGLRLLTFIPLYESAFGGSFKSLRQDTRTPALISGNDEQSRQLTPYRQRSRSGNGKVKGHQIVAHDLSPGPELVSMWRPKSSVAEQFRVAATRLELLGEGRKSTVVVVTSAVMGEGKSTTALNLGYTLARDLDKQTLLIDCDLKRPTQHVYAGVALKPGLADLLHGNKPFEDCRYPLGEMDFWILPAGSVKDRPLELSKMQLVANLLTELRHKFEYIIVDAPPVLPLADMNVLASLADVLVFVIRAEETGRDVVQKALKAIGDTSQIGIVLNGLDSQGTPYYMQSYYSDSHHEQLK